MSYRLPLLVNGRFGAAQFEAGVGYGEITLPDLSASASRSVCREAAGRGHRLTGGQEQAFAKNCFPSVCQAGSSPHR